MDLDKIFVFTLDIWIRLMLININQLLEQRYRGAHAHARALSLYFASDIITVESGIITAIS